MFALSLNDQQLKSAVFFSKLLSLSGQQLMLDSEIGWLAKDTSVELENSPVRTLLEGELRDNYCVAFGEGLSLSVVQSLCAELFPDEQRVSIVTTRHRRQLLNLVAFELHPFETNDIPSTQRLRDIARRFQLNLLPVTAQSPAIKQPGLCLLDIDSTVIDIECIDELARAHGVFDKVAAITEAAMRGELDFEQSLRSRVAALQGLPVVTMQQLANGLPINKGFTNLVLELKRNKWKVALASGGFMPIAKALATRFELDFVIANNLMEEKGLYTGKLTGDIVDAQHKADTLMRLMQQFDVPASQTMAIGDGANDLLMLNKAAVGVAFHAKPKVAAAADVAIDEASLDNALLSLR